MPALWSTAARGHTRVVQLLCSHGADIKAALAVNEHLPNPEVVALLNQIQAQTERMQKAYIGAFSTATVVAVRANFYNPLQARNDLNRSTGRLQSPLFSNTQQSTTIEESDICDGTFELD